MRKTIIFFVLFFCFLRTFSQRQGINGDSIYNLISTAHDSMKPAYLNSIARNIITDYPDSSFNLVNRALKIATKLGRQKSMAKSYFLLGYYYSNKGKHDISIDYYDKAITIYEKFKMKDDICNIYNSLGNTFMLIGNGPVGDEYYTKCYNLAKSEPQSKYYMALAAVGMARIKADNKKNKEALELYFIARDYLKELKMFDYVAMVLQNISTIYSDINKLDEAEKYNDEAIEELQKSNNLYGLSTAYGTRAFLYQAKGNKAGAIEYAQKSYTISTQINNFPEMADKASMLHLLYKENKDYKRALEYHELFMQHKDSVLNKEQGLALAEAETRFETKQKEAELLVKNSELEKSEMKVDQRNNLIYFFIGTIIIFLFLLILVYKQFSEKKKSNKILQSQNHEIEKQSALIEEKNKDITDSINYSKFIQQAIIPSPKKVKQFLPESFVIFKPKDIVSGDFYLVEEVVGLIYLAVVDCTGHGVPGAMLSVFADSTIKNSISSNQFRDSPAAILSDLCFQFKSNLQTDTTANTVNDGVDMAICIIDKKAGKLSFAGARNGLMLVRNNTILELAPSRSGISGSNKGQQLFYEDHFIDIRPGDKFYIYTDGYADQFGGEKGKKFKQKQLNALLVDCHDLPMEKQKDLIESKFNSWKGSLEQVDDVTLIGFSI